MDRVNPLYWWRRLLALPNDSTTKTFTVALLIALTSALIVSTTSVLLRPIQEINRERDRQAQIVAVVSAGVGDAGALRARIVDLESGRFNTELDPAMFDQRAAARDEERSIAIPAPADIAGLGRRAKHARVFTRVTDGKLDLIVLPVHGQGYQSMLYGYLALRGDLNTVAALTFYEQGETPGLGARITDKVWQAEWRGKKVADDSGTVKIGVASGKTTGPHDVDGISGASRTAQGVTNLLRFWLGEYGYGQLLAQLRQGKT